MKRGRREGFILVSTLGALIVLAGLVGAVSYLVRTAVVGAAAQRESLTVDALLQSGAELAGYQLFTLRRPASALNGQRVRLDDGIVTLFAEAESGKIDLNGAAPELLAAVWSAVGASGLTPETFAARVVDYRDRDREVSKNGGAESPQYVAAGPNRTPADAPFEQVDDVQNVLGVTPAAARALAPLLTVHNPAGKVSAYEASRAVLRALPGGARAVDWALALRARPPARDGEAPAEDAPEDAAKFLALEPGSKAFTVRVEVERGTARRAVTLVLTASRAPDALYFVTDRKEVAAR